jgi:exosortase/archaeosortase
VIYQSHYLNSAPYPFEFRAVLHLNRYLVFSKLILYAIFSFLYAAHEANQTWTVNFDITCLFTCYRILRVSDMNHFTGLNLITQNNRNKFHFRFKIFSGLSKAELYAKCKMLLSKPCADRSYCPGKDFWAESGRLAALAGRQQ